MTSCGCQAYVRFSQRHTESSHAGISLISSADRAPMPSGTGPSAASEGPPHSRAVRTAPQSRCRGSRRMQRVL